MPCQAVLLPGGDGKDLVEDLSPLRHVRVTATYVPHRTDRPGKKRILAASGELCSFLTEPVFLRSSRVFSRAICLQDHTVFRQEAAGVCEQSRV
jgi:hypothetical protein